MTLLVIAFLSAFVAFILAFLMRRLAWRVKFVDHPDAGRHQQSSAVALGGGIVAWLACIFLVALSFVLPVETEIRSHIPTFQLLGIFLATLPLLLTGILDDLYRLSSKWLVLGGVASVSIVLAFGIRIDELTQIGGGVYALSSGVSFLLTGVWLLLCMGATKFSDGVDGLVAGQTCIGAALIAGLALSSAFYQPNIALLALIFGGAFFGVLLHNWPYARLYLGEFGSTFAGLGLGILAILSGAKLAIALMAMGFFLADILRVMMMRVWRGHSPFVGDRTHLHFLLRDAGLPAWGVSMCMWVFALIFGLAALQFQTQGKMLLFAGVLVLTWGSAFFLERRLWTKTA